MATTTALASIEAQLARYIDIPATLLQDGMVTPAGQVRDVRQDWFDNARYVLWTDAFGRLRGAKADGGWVTVAKASVTHKVRIRQVPVMFMGCPTGNYDNTAVCTGCGWDSGEPTSSGFMVGRWAAEHEQTASAVSR